MVESEQDKWGHAGGLEDALAASASHVRVTAAAGAGKTEYLVRKAAQLVNAGTQAERILYVVSSPTAGYAVRDRLAAANEGLAACAVKTPLETCTSILEQQAARHGRGQKPRVLCGAELNMLLEDLKTETDDATQLRSMLKKAFAGLGTLSAEDKWGFTDAEAALYCALQKHLDFLGALLPEQAPALAATYVQGDASAQGTYDAVLVDDAHNISSATLALCMLLSADFVALTGNPNQAQAGFDRAASIQAFSDFGADATCFLLAGKTQPAAIAAFGDALCQVDPMDKDVIASIPSCGLPNEQALTCIKWHEPDDEFAGVAQIVRNLMNDREGTDPGDIFILAPNRAWAQAIAKRLEKRRVDSVVMMDADPVVGDPRSATPGTLDAYCRLALAANENDAAAWRLWCGLGDKQCRRKQWAHFLSWAEEKNLGCTDALRVLCDASADTEEPFEGAGELRQCCAEAQQAIADLANRRGFALLKALSAAPLGKQVGNLLEPIEGDEDASELHKRLVELSLEPYFIPNPHRVAIGSYKLIQGLSPRHVIACGLVDGYMPAISHAALVQGDAAALARLHAERRVFYNAVCKARETLILSTVQRAEADVAEKLRLDARRTKREHGRNVVILARSCFVDEAGDAAPSSVSGEQFLSVETVAQPG